MNESLIDPIPTHLHGCGAYLAAKGHECDCDIVSRLRAYAERLSAEVEPLKLKEAVLMDLHTALGVKWGEDPYAAIVALRESVERLGKDAQLVEARAYEAAAKVCDDYANLCTGAWVQPRHSLLKCAERIRALSAVRTTDAAKDG